MKNDSDDPSDGAASSLVADYLVVMLQPLSALADAASLSGSKAAIDRALETVVSEGAGPAARRIRSAP